jgi:hypothetical protein
MAVVGEDRTRGHPRPANADTSGESGWVTTEVAARAVRVSPRTIRRYIERGELDAKPQGEGVNRTWLVSVDSLHTLRASRTIEGESPQGVLDADSMADVFRELAARLEQRAAEAAELRTRLELTERTQSTLEDERRRALEELSGERRRREEAERERDELRLRLEALGEARESSESPADEQQGRGPVPDAGGPHEGTERPWWRRIFEG